MTSSAVSRVRRAFSTYAQRGRRDANTVSQRTLTGEQMRAYRDDGFVVARGMMDGAEMSTIAATVARDNRVRRSSIDRLDAQGLKSSLSLMTHVGDNAFGAVVRCGRLVDSAEMILGDEVYHYHSKVMVKKPRVGGAWEWHQDYGYWYQNGCLYPTMMSVMVAIDSHTQHNGCLQVLKASHKFGRLNHTLTGQQAGADPQRVEWAKERCELVNVECAPGDVLFFDSLLLHASQPNLSDHPRSSFIICYNTRNNNPTIAHHHASYTPLDRWDDGCVVDKGAVGVSDGDGTVFMRHEEDSSAQSLVGKSVDDV